MSEKYVVTWDMFHMHARKLSERLLPASQWKGIVAVSRGGLFPAAVLARELGIRHVETVCIASYNHDKQGELQVLHAAQLDNGGEGFIVIDDLVDTGNTARAIREMYPNARFVTVLQNRPARNWWMIMWWIFHKIHGSNSLGIWVFVSFHRWLENNVKSHRTFYSSRWMV